MENQACPCCSALPYRDCCLPPHLGRPAADALALMRSRYAAYVLQLTDYIVATTVPAQQRLGLEVFDFQTLPGGRHALVDFAARFADADGQEQTHRELSAFVRSGGRWYFIDPTVSLPAPQTPCFCGSGRKFKSCCGRFFR